MTWKHLKGLYLNKQFRIFFEDGEWWLCDIRKGVTKCPSWPCSSAKEAKAKAERVRRKPCGHYHNLES